MKFAINKTHREFFNKNGWIEFENFIIPENLRILNQSIDQTIAERLAIEPTRIPFTTSEKLYMNGHDIWRSNEYLRKFIGQARLAEIASELFELRSFRIGYDQFFPFCSAITSTYVDNKQTKKYETFLNDKTTLEEVSSLNGMVGGVMFCLSDSISTESPESQEPSEEKLEEESADQTEEKKGSNVFPILPGQAIFIKPELLIDWSTLYTHFKQRFYLIVYTQSKTIYELKPKDPHAHFLKHLGYVLNDRLTDKLNPLIYR